MGKAKSTPAPPPDWGSHVDPAAQPQIPPPPDVVHGANIPVRGSAAESATDAMEASAQQERDPNEWPTPIESVAPRTLRETGSQASAAIDPVYENDQGILTTEELQLEKIVRYNVVVGQAPMMETTDGTCLPPPAMVPFLSHSVKPRIDRFADGQVFAEHPRPFTATAHRPMAENYPDSPKTGQNVVTWEEKSARSLFCLRLKNWVDMWGHFLQKRRG